VRIHWLPPLILMIGVSISTAAPAAAQTVIDVRPGGDLQAALNIARPGDTIALAPGAVYVGNFTLPAKGGGAFITLRSATPDHLLPGPNTRIDPRYAPLLARIQSPNNAPALATAPGASHYRLQFLEFGPSANGSGTIVALGDGSARQNSLTMVPHSLVVDRVYIHGDPDRAQRRGIALNSASTQIVNSWISDIKAAGVDAQAICGWNGPGPFLIANNYLEGSGENVMFGGGDPAIPGLVPSDITFVGNHVAKPLSWRGSQWTVKNLFELKNAQRVHVDRNLFENNWLAAQVGYAILLKSVNQDGGAPWSVVQHVQFTNNVVRNVASAVNILGRDTRYPAIEANNISVRNNLFVNVSGAAFGGSGRMLLINGAAQVTFDHNTAIVDGTSAVFADVNATPGFVFTNNVLFDNGLGVKGSGTGAGTATLARYFPGAQFAGNVIGGANPSMYPGGNHYPPIAAIGFVDFGRGDFRLAASSPFKRAATTGADPGADFNQLTGMGGTVPPLGPAPQFPEGNGPGAPRGLSSRLTGRTVTLTWTAPANGVVTSYVLEAGTAPGLNNAAVANVGSGTSLVVHDVPPNTYYVRIRALNGGAASAPSAEIVVAVR
jgi:hypothetical protein